MNSIGHHKVTNSIRKSPKMTTVSLEPDAKSKKSARKPSDDERYLNVIISRQAKKLLRSRAGFEECSQDVVVDQALLKFLATPPTREEELTRTVKSNVPILLFSSIDKRRSEQRLSWQEVLQFALTVWERTQANPGELSAAPAGPPRPPLKVPGKTTTVAVPWDEPSGRDSSTPPHPATPVK